MATQGFRDLRVWQAGVDFAVSVYALTRSFPPNERYGLAGQMQRAAVSISSNIAEGKMRDHIREYVHHVAIARGSLAEVETQLEIAARLGYVTDDQAHTASAVASSLGKQLTALHGALQRGLTTHR